MPVILLCHFDGTNGSTTFTDTWGGHTLTPSSVTVTTGSPKFGTGCGDFTAGASSYINVSTAADFDIGSQQFTVEAWAYFTSAPGGGTFGVLTQFGGSSNLAWFFGIVSGNLAFYYSVSGSDLFNVGVSYTPALNTWIHLAADRDASNMLRVYANGVVVASATVTATIFASTFTCVIGNDHNLTRAFPGHLDEARVTMGLAQYGGAFTPPTAPFPDPGGAVAATLTPSMMLSASRAGIGSVVLVQDNASRTVMIADVGVLSQTAQAVPGGAQAYAMILA